MDHAPVAAASRVTSLGATTTWLWQRGWAAEEEEKERRGERGKRLSSQDGGTGGRGDGPAAISSPCHSSQLPFRSDLRALIGETIKVGVDSVLKIIRHLGGDGKDLLRAIMQKQSRWFDALFREQLIRIFFRHTANLA